MQILLTVEQEAQQIVNATNSAKMARLKQAKEEAEKEVAEYRAQMELEFQRKSHREQWRFRCRCEPS
ncbi:hypothetical protein CsSME_00038375 [Camellia sinensis var. sinensis]